MPGKVETWDLDEVCIWMNAIGLGEKVQPFRENTVDGETLVSLSHGDLTQELGLSTLQAKKVLRCLDETKEMAAMREGGGSEGGGNPIEIQQLKDKLEAKNAKIHQLEEENKKLKEKLDQMEANKATAAPANHPPPQQANYPPPEQTKAPPPQTATHQHHKGPGVVGGAARGAAGGAVKGAVIGAILPGMTAGNGAAAGAAAGAVGGAGKGLRGRLRR